MYNRRPGMAKDKRDSKNRGNTSPSGVSNVNDTYHHTSPVAFSSQASTEYTYVYTTLMNGTVLPSGAATLIRGDQDHDLRGMRAQFGASNRDYHRHVSIHNTPCPYQQPILNIKSRQEHPSCAAGQLGSYLLGSPAEQYAATLCTTGKRVALALPQGAALSSKLGPIIDLDMGLEYE